MQALRDFYEGQTYMDKQKEEAYHALSKAHYKREIATFNFEMLTGILTRAYNDLDR